MSFNVKTDTQFTSELINFLARKENEGGSLPDGINWGDYLYWNGIQYTVGDQNITLGANAGEFNQQNQAVAMGSGAGQYTQGYGSIAIGQGAGSVNQGLGGEACCAIAVGAGAGSSNQGFFTVAVGAEAAVENQSPGSIAIGFLAGASNQGGLGQGMNCCATAIGVYAGNTNQGSNATAIGMGSGAEDQGDSAISIGYYAGSYSQGYSAIAIGSGAGATNQSSTAIAIGFNAGSTNQGFDAIAIGNSAGYENQANQSIVINATGSVLDNQVSGTCILAPVRDTQTVGFNMSYIPSTSEIVYTSNPKIVRSFGQGDELLLSDYNTTHYYYWNNPEATLQYIDIPTNMVEDSVYEVTFNASGSSTPNNDMMFFPNYSGYTNFYSNYMNRSGTGVVSLQTSYTNSSGFNFDLVAGSNGYDPVGKITIFNNRGAKKIRVEVGDTCAITTGDGYWLTNSSTPNGGALSYDTTTQWLTVGRLQFGAPSFTNVVATVRRIV